MIVHLVDDEKFINLTIEKFEISYPGKNIFIVDTSKKQKGKSLKYVNLNINSNVYSIALADKYAVDHILRICSHSIDVIVVHTLSSIKAYTVMKLQVTQPAKSYWICTGADLYGWLYVGNKYNLYDYNILLNKLTTILSYLYWNCKFSFKVGSNLFSSSTKLLKILDFFCTWNIFDYQLVKQNFKTNAVHKSFHYPMAGVDDFPEIETSVKKNMIMVNQSASKSGNHLTVLTKIHNLDFNRKIDEIILPLSYGNPRIKRQVLSYVNSNLFYCAKSLDTFMDKASYFNLLRDVKCAFFGHRRQEAANNILFLLGFGAKVFLRKDNNLLAYFRFKGYFIFEFEADFNSIEDLCVLELDKQIKNRELVIAEFSETNFKAELAIFIEFAK